MPNVLKAKNRRQRRIIVLLSLVVVVFILKDTVATNLVRRDLEERGWSCEGLHGELNWSFSQIHLEPFDCIAEEGLIESLRFESAVDVRVLGLSPTRVQSRRVTLGIRSGSLADGIRDWLPEIARGSGMRGRVVAAVHVLGQLLRMSQVPELELGHVNIRRARRPLASFEGLRLVPDEPSTLSFERGELASVNGLLSGMASVSLTSVRGSVSADEMSLRGSVEIRASVPFLGDLARHQSPFEFGVSELQSETPRFRFDSEL